MRKLSTTAGLALTAMALASAAFAAWQSRIITVALLMSNTSWSVAIREVHLAKDKKHLDIVAELIAPQDKAVGRAHVMVRDSIKLLAPAVKHKFWIIQKEPWYEGQRVKGNFLRKPGQEDSCSAHGSSCAFVLPDDKRLQKVRAEKPVPFEHSTEQAPERAGGQ